MYRLEQISYVLCLSVAENAPEVSSHQQQEAASSKDTAADNSLTITFSKCTVPSAATAGAGGPPTVQQTLLQQQIVRQIQMAVQAGLISPQLLNQCFTPSMLIMLQQLHHMLQQLHQLQQVLQRLIAQQQLMESSKTLPVIQKRQQLEQIQITIQKIQKQILNHQQQIQASQQPAGAASSSGAPTATTSSVQSAVAAAAAAAAAAQAQHQLGDGTKPPAADLLNKGMQDLAVKDSTSAVGSSRLSQWKQPPEKPSTSAAAEDSNLNKAVGFKPLQSSHSTPNRQQTSPGGTNSSAATKLSEANPFSDSTWSTTLSGGSAWPSSSVTSNGSTEQGDGENNGSTSRPTGSSSGTPTSNPDNDLDLEEFVPGQRWQGLSTKTIDDDPYLTPASVSRSFSVNTIDEKYIMSTLGSHKASSTSPTGKFSLLSQQ